MVETAFRPLRSYVLREGRLTKGQRRAIDQLWSRYGLALPPARETLNYSQIFGRVAPTRIEIGFGDGDALLEMATQNPQCNFIGIEVHRPGVGRLLLQLEARAIDNVKVFCDDGVTILSRAIAEQSLDAVYLYFPDPWHKKKHHKRRLMQPTFIQLLASRLVAGGCLHFATDWQPYAEQTLGYLQQSDLLENCAGEAGYFTAPERPSTKFERRGHALGHDVWDIVMRKRDAP